MPSYKLYYFDVPARGELPRVLFAAADIPFEDIRIGLGGNAWPIYKAKMPFEQVPVLEIDGQMLAQEYAISKYLANMFGLSGAGYMEQARADMYVFASEDIYVKAEEIYHERTDASKVTTLTKKFVEEVAPRLLSKFESDLSSSTSGFLVGDKMTWSDIALFVNVGVMEAILPTESATLLVNYPSVRKNMATVRSKPSIAAYLKTRPSSPSINTKDA